MGDVKKDGLTAVFPARGVPETSYPYDDVALLVPV